MKQWQLARRSFLGGLMLAPLLASTGTATAAAEADTSPPGVVPALQSWTGGTGSLPLTSASRVVVPTGAPAALRNLAVQVVEEVAELTSLRLTTATGAAGRGDILLRIDSSADFGPVKSELRPEAYRLTVSTTSAEIVGGGQRGAYYGTRTLLQALLGSADHQSVPAGTAVDYPNYALRGFMLDVGRRYFTPDFIRSYLHWMGWLKLNTLQLHLNDNEISAPNGDWSQAISAFRLKSANPAFAGLGADQGYTRQDWDSFEDVAAANGVTIIAEIDAPAHARAFIEFKPEIGLNDGNSDHLDLTNPAATDFMKSLYTEFAPWFRGPAVHIGVDEYPRELSAQYKAYVNAIASHVRSLGKTVNAWGSFTVMSGGGSGYDKNMVLNCWNHGWYSPQAAMADGYRIINSNDGLLYVVPFADYYHGQGLDGQYIFNSWEPHVFGGTHDLTAQDPMLLGAMPAVWNDLVRAGYTELQVHGLVEKSFAALAQKMWSGTRAGTDYSSFLSRVGTVGQGPGTAYLPDTLVTPKPTPGDLAFGRAVSASSSEVPALGPSNAVDGNPDTRWASAYTDDEWLSVDLGSRQSFSRVNLDWEAAHGRDYDVRVSDDGSSWRTVAQRRGLAQKGVDTLAFTAVTARHVQMRGITRATGFGYSLHSFEVIGSDLALHGAVSASSSEVPALGPSNAVDGNPDTRWASAYTDDEWLSVDLGSRQSFSRVNLDWEAAHGRDYDVRVSDDGSSWRTVAQRRGLAQKGVDTLAFTAVTARHVQMRGITRATGFGYSLHSFEVRN